MTVKDLVSTLSIDYDSGLAKCRKHDLYVEWLKKRELNKMVCVEEKECTE